MKFCKRGLSIVCAATAVAAALVLASCGTASPAQKTEILDNKGAALGINTPDWVTKWVTSGNAAVEALPEYKDAYCFVVNSESKDKAFLLAWTGNLNGPAAIANVISTTISQDVAGREGYVEGEERDRVIRANMEMMSNASYTGARKMADWWQLVRNKATKDETFQAFVLYTFGKKVLDDQIARNLQNIVDNNIAMSAAERAIYAELIQEIRVNGFQQR
jgi:hypothetical protein